MAKSLSKILFLLVALALLAAACQPAAAPATPTATARPAGQVTPTAGSPPPTATPLPPGAPSPTPRPPTSTAVPPTATSAGVQPQYGGRLRIILLGEPAHHDPHMLNWPAAFQQAFQGLMGLDPQSGQPRCELCDSFEYKSPTTLVFHLHQGTKFHNFPPTNGREMTAEDVIYSINRQRTPSVADFPNSSRWILVSSMKALDKYTVEITLKSPSASFLYAIPGSAAIVPKEAIEQFGDFKSPNNFIGTGAFVRGKYTPGIGGSMERSPDFWQKDRPYLDGIDLSLITDQATIMAAYRTGRIDYGGNLVGSVTLQQKRDLLRTTPSIEVYPLPDSWVDFLLMNLSQKPFNDIRVRKAIHLAIDRQEALATSLGGDEGGDVSGPLSYRLFPGFTYSREDLLKKPGYRQPKDADIAEAKRFIAEAGYPNGLDIPAEACDCFPHINLWAMESAKVQLRKIGINITIKTIDQTQYFGQDRTGQFLFRARGVGASLDPGEQLYLRHHSKGTRNFQTQQWSDPKLDELLDAQAAELDVAKRQKLTIQAQDILLEDLPQIWIWVSQSFSVKQAWVKGFTPSIYSSYFWPNVWIDKTKVR